jgi:hypothetical protein
VDRGRATPSMRGTEREPERLARKVRKQLACQPRRRLNEHEAPPANTIAFKATSYRRRTAVAEPWRAGCLPQQPA